MRRWRVVHGDSIEHLKTLEPESIDSCVTDPPYGLGKPPDPIDVLTKWIAGDPYIPKGKGFKGHEWDAFVPGPELWREVYRVMKPGAHGVVFGGTRTNDWIGIALRLAGFEIRDQLQWLHGEGMGKSKSLDDGAMGTGLKPAHEPIWLVRKPIRKDLTLVQNYMVYGTGGIAIDDCRIEATPEDFEKLSKGVEAIRQRGGVRNNSWKNSSDLSGANPANPKGRWPANIVIDEHTAALIDQQSGIRPGMKSGGVHSEGYSGGMFGKIDSSNTGRGDTGGASRFFYCAKAGPTERDGTNHPNVKPNKLMRWLVRLVTPQGGLVLDTFMGSGSTGIAAVQEGRRFLGIDKMNTEEEPWVDDARRRIMSSIPSIDRS